MIGSNPNSTMADAVLAAFPWQPSAKAYIAALFLTQKSVGIKQLFSNVCITQRLTHCVQLVTNTSEPVTTAFQ